MKVQDVQKLNNINETASAQAAKLRYGFGTYAAPRVQEDLYSLTSNLVKKNPIESVYEKFLAKYNPNALLEKYMSEDAVNKMLEKAPIVNQILAEKGVQPKACIDNLKNIKNSHVKTTVDVAVALADEMNLSTEDKQIVALGSIFHDFGKIMIPEEVLNKHGKLSASERSIVDTHSQIGYELLKTTGMDSRALAIVRNHHRSASMTNDVLSKIVSVADVYSALTEERPYKAKMSNDDAFTIMKAFVEEGKLDGQIVDALYNHLENNEQAA
ncbi:MAG: HD domain-containing protein [Candidatus Gastranaerophilales bacterium]|nr:HD domain-containing protein [Candidatus Gastranaerophilales bacterium]